MDFKDPDDILKRYESYVNRPEKIKLGTKLFNYITDGGYERKTLNLYMATTHVGKTWKLIDDAAFLFLNGYNVLYITLEMSKEKIMQRIETNLFDLPTAQFRHLSFEKYKQKLIETKKKTVKLGKLIVEEFPPDTANINHFNVLLDELYLKKDFKPDVIIVDYLAIMKPTDSDLSGLYEKNKKIAEQLRKIAVENNVCLISAIQTNRDGFNVSDFTMSVISECLDLNTIVEMENGKKIKISEINVGDKIKGFEKFVKVNNIFPIKRKKQYKIKLKSGKEIICSGDHKFPVKGGFKCINTGLKISDKLNSI